MSVARRTRSSSAAPRACHTTQKSRPSTSLNASRRVADDDDHLADRRSRRRPSTAPFITLAGTAADDVGIASVTWVNNRGGSGAAIGTTSWTAADIPLAGGRERDHRDGDRTRAATRRPTPSRYGDAASPTRWPKARPARSSTSTSSSPTRTPCRRRSRRRSSRRTARRSTQHLQRRRRLSQLTIARRRHRRPREARRVSSDMTSTTRPAARRRADDVLGRPATTASHTGTAVDGPRTRWFFAEGSQGFFHDVRAARQPERDAGERHGSFLPECERHDHAHVRRRADVALDDLRRPHPGAGRPFVRDRSSSRTRRSSRSARCTSARRAF